jgi:hypothetical protein
MNIKQGFKVPFFLKCTAYFTLLHAHTVNCSEVWGTDAFKCIANYNIL